MLDEEQPLKAAISAKTPTRRAIFTPDNARIMALSP
jgi:hypothetical protein